MSETRPAASVGAADSETTRRETIAPKIAGQNAAVAVIWIDWYPYHVARFAGLHSVFAGNAVGIELVGGVGVHAGLRFREELPGDLPVITLMPEASWQSAGQWRLAVKLWQTLGRVNPRVVLVPGYYTLPALAAAVWAKLYRRASVLMTESTAADHLRVGWKERGKSLLLRTLFDWAVTGGTAHRRYLEQLGFPMERVLRFYDVVDNEYFRQQAIALRGKHAAEFGLPEGYFLYIGRLSEEKNVPGLLAEWTEYRNGGGTWPLVLVGDGPAAAELQAAAAKSRYAAQIHFAGHKGVAELPIYYAFANCFVLPSTREPWGLVVNEAMASGLPVIVSSRCGCAEDLVEVEGNGFVFQPSRTGELRECLVRMEAGGEEGRLQMGARSLERIGRYSPQAFGEEVATIGGAGDVRAQVHSYS